MPIIDGEYREIPNISNEEYEVLKEEFVGYSPGMALIINDLSKKMDNRGVPLLDKLAFIRALHKEYTEHYNGKIIDLYLKK